MNAKTQAPTKGVQKSSGGTRSIFASITDQISVNTQRARIAAERDRIAAELDAELTRIANNLNAELARITDTLNAKRTQINAELNAELAQITAKLDTERARIDADPDAVHRSISAASYQTYATVCEMLAEYAQPPASLVALLAHQRVARTGYTEIARKDAEIHAKYATESAQLKAKNALFRAELKANSAVENANINARLARIAAERAATQENIQLIEEEQQHERVHIQNSL